MPSSDKKLKKEEEEWIHKQINWYYRKRPHYWRCAKMLRKVLEHASRRYAPHAIIQARAKTIPSYADKIESRIDRYRQTDSEGKPLHPVTDLCGVRVITYTLPQIKAICNFIENHFDIDWENSVNVATRLTTTEFGYLSIHYVVRFRSDVFPNKEVSTEIPKTVYGLDAEIQVRTLLEHAWAEIEHSLRYKRPFDVPEKWRRDIARLAAILEEADEDFSRLESRLTAYEANYGAHMTTKQMRAKMARLDTVLDADPTNMDVALRIASLAKCSGDWAKAVKVLKPFSNSDFAPVLRDLGLAMCKLYKKNGRNFRQGQKLMERAIKLDPTDSDAIASFGGTWKGINEGKAMEQYRKAFEVNPDDPYPLGNYLEYEIAKWKNLNPVSFAMPSLKNAIQKCRDQADVGMNMPWAFYDMGKFHLLLREFYKSLNTYAKAVDVSAEIGMIKTSLKSVEKLNVVKEEIPDLEWVQRFLLIAIVNRPESKRPPHLLKRLTTDENKPLHGPVVIVAGGCDARTEQQIGSYRQLVLEAFADFEGTVISGGTVAGISGLVGDVGAAYPETIRTIGYVPCNASADNDKRRYHEIRRTTGQDFSPQEPLMAWSEIVTSDVPITQVKLLGIGGGMIAAVEYRLALALGIIVGVVKDSGRAVSELLKDEDWNSSENLLELPADTMTIRAFIDFGIHRLPTRMRENIARNIHETYQRIRATHLKTFDLSVVEWEELPEFLKESNRQEADYILHALKLSGFKITKAKSHKKISLMKFSGQQNETMAEMEHGRWNIERLLSGWKLGQDKDISKKVSPYLVAWEQLPETAKELDRQMVSLIPEILAKVGLEISRNVGRQQK